MFDALTLDELKATLVILEAEVKLHNKVIAGQREHRKNSRISSPLAYFPLVTWEMQRDAVADEVKRRELWK